MKMKVIYNRGYPINKSTLIFKDMPEIIPCQVAEMLRLLAYDFGCQTMYEPTPLCDAYFTTFCQTRNAYPMFFHE